MLISPFPHHSFASANEIVISLNNWSSQRVESKALGILLNSYGIPTRFVEASTDEQWGALRKGIVHLQIEVWAATDLEILGELVNKGELEILGNHNANTREDWWYPEYVKQQCPGLPDWKALNRCSAMFSSTPDSSKGVYYNGPWNYHDGNLIRALNLNFTVQRLKNGEALRRILAEHVAQQKPIVMRNLSPNWTDAKIKGEFVKFPAWQIECETDPAWGINPDVTHDCANEPRGNIKKVVWPGLQQHSPCVYQILRNISFDNYMIGLAAALVVYPNYFKILDFSG